MKLLLLSNYKKSNQECKIKNHQEIVLLLWKQWLRNVQLFNKLLMNKV